MSAPVLPLHLETILGDDEDSGPYIKVKIMNCCAKNMKTKLDVRDELYICYVAEFRK